MQHTAQSPHPTPHSTRRPTPPAVTSLVGPHPQSGRTAVCWKTRHGHPAHEQYQPHPLARPQHDPTRNAKGSILGHTQAFVRGCLEPTTILAQKPANFISARSRQNDPFCKPPRRNRLHSWAMLVPNSKRSPTHLSNESGGRDTYWNLTISSQLIPCCYTFVMVCSMLLCARYRCILFLYRITQINQVTLDLG